MNQALQEFFERLKSDSALQASCSEAVARGDLDAIVRIGGEAGFGFTVEDLKQAWEQQSDALSEADLANVAGGAGGIPGRPITICTLGCIGSPNAILSDGLTKLTCF